MPNGLVFPSQLTMTLRPRQRVVLPIYFVRLAAVAGFERRFDPA